MTGWDDERVAELRLVLGADYEQLARAFVAESPARLAHLKGLLAADSPQGPVDMVHQWKGTASTLGAARLSEVLGVFEAALQAEGSGVDLGPLEAALATLAPPS